MHQFLCLSERGGNFLKFALERGVPKKEGGGGGGFQPWRKRCFLKPRNKRELLEHNTASIFLMKSFRGLLII